MCSELFRIPTELFGVPLFGVGIVLAVWIVVSAIGMWQLTRRGAPRGDITYALVMAAAVAALIIFLPRMGVGSTPRLASTP